LRVPWRSKEPSRIEGFSDAVFGFALTLLVVSVEVPQTFDELMTVVRGFLPFAITFATIAWLWYEHYYFFRLFDPDDRVTIALNCALLFTVLFYVYPLKFMFTLVVNGILGLASFEAAYMRAGEGSTLMIVYGVGYIVVFVTFAAMYFNVMQRRASMQLNRLEAFEAKAGVVGFLALASVGVVSISIVLIGGDAAAPWSGMSYSLIGVVKGVFGWIHGSQRVRLRAEQNLAV
jgi:uncharacterized membrane protein